MSKEVGRVSARATGWMRLAARLLALTWASAWTAYVWFAGVAEGFSQTELVLHSLGPGLILWASVALGWWWDLGGGAVLILVGLVSAIGFPLLTYGSVGFRTMAIVLLALAQPPLTAGALFLLCWHRSKA